MEALTRTDNPHEINERFYDDSAFLPIGSSMSAPSTTGVLLFQLKLSNADRTTQSAGMADWLRDHTPSAGLVRSLQRRSFGDLVDGGNDPSLRRCGVTTAGEREILGAGNGGEGVRSRLCDNRLASAPEINGPTWRDWFGHLVQSRGFAGNSDS